MFPRRTGSKIESRRKGAGRLYGYFSEFNTLEGPGVILYNNGDFFLGYFKSSMLSTGPFIQIYSRNGSFRVGVTEKGFFRVFLKQRGLIYYSSGVTEAFSYKP